MTKFNVALFCSECDQTFRTGELWPPDNRPICTECINAGAYFHKYDETSRPALERGTAFYNEVLWKVWPLGINKYDPKQRERLYTSLAEAIGACDEILEQRGTQWYQEVSKP